VRQSDDFSQLIGNVIDGKTQLALLSYSSDVLDGSDVFTQVVQQTGNYKSATLDQYLKEAGSTIDQTDRLAVLQKTSKFLMDDVAAIPLLNRERVWVSDKSYVVQFDNIAASPGIYFWKAYLAQ
jgi:ABC-type transport system substrate-binding protein